MQITALVRVLALLLAGAMVCVGGGYGGGKGHHHIIIQVPYHVKKIHHTHTIYKIIDHGGHGDHHHVFH